MLRTIFNRLNNERGEVVIGDDWKTTIPDDVVIPFKDDKGQETQIKLKDHPSAAKFKDAGSVFKSYLEAEKQISSRIAIPGKDATPEEKRAFLNKIGVPEKAEGYKLSEVKGLHGSVKITPEGNKAFLEAAHAAGVTNEAADNLHQWFLKNVSDTMAAQEAANTEKFETAKEALVKDWGAKYQENVDSAAKFVELIAGKDAIKGLGEYGNNPILLKLLQKASTLISEDAIKKLTGGGGSGDANKDALQKIEAINNLRGDDRKKHPYWNENDPKHAEAVQEVRELYKTAYAPQN